MVKILAPIVYAIFGFFLIGCSISYRDKTPKQNLSEIEIKKSTMVSFKKVKTADNTIIGYLEETENTVASPNSPSGRESIKIFYVYDKDFNKIGFMTGQGAVSVYQYTAKGTITKVVTGMIYTVETGNRSLLSYGGAIYYEDFEPAPIWHDKR
ncbi:MAG: hypothetical protein HZA49_00965 [Planctomycetes bacterium]|nr:hypothetical protein [Planctomycetota bacterium]